jgi:hypothetical protein
MKKEKKIHEGILLIALKYFCEDDPANAWMFMFDDPPTPAARKAVAAARKRIPKPGPPMPSFTVGPVQ